MEKYDIKEVMEWFGEVPDENMLKAKVISAEYECGGYEGDAFVLFELDGKLFEAHGSHCSCYGLEGQWDAEETNREALMHRITKGYSYGAFAVCYDEIKAYFGE